MRLRPRPTVKETSTKPPDDEVALGGVELPRKARSLLGTKVQVNVSNSKDNKREDFAQMRKAEQKNFGTRFAAQKAPEIPLPSGITGSGITDMPSWSTATASNRSSSDILPTPTASPGQNGGSTRNGSSTGVRTSQFYPGHQQSIESMNREYYDPAKQPLYVSQQTSASAVRDMALRKGSPTVHQMASAQAPNKSAMKPSKSSPNADTNEKSKKPKKLDLSSLFPRPTGSQARLLSPAKYSHSPSAMTDLTEFFPQETTQAELRRSGPNGRFETHKNSPKPESVEISNTPRVKIFEPDIYDNTKTHSRKPPKGIKNWFDGFDISSDEDENDPVELPANPPRPSVEQIPSDFSPYPVTAPEKPLSNSSGHSPRPVQDNLHPMDPAKAIMRRRMQKNGSESSTATEDSSGGANGNQKRSGESRFTHSRLDSQSVLSLSSESEEEPEVLPSVRDSRYAIEDEETLGANLPSPVPRKREDSQGLTPGLGLQTSSLTAPTPGIPSKLRDSTLAPIAVDDWAAYSEEKKTPTQPEQAVAKDAGSRDAKSRTTNRSNEERKGLKSAGGETNASSAPSDASHVMAVTEEEMMLLELMRKKRAAMQKNSFAEGYRLALKQEQDYLTKRRQSAHNSVSKMLIERANKEGRFSPAGLEAEAERAVSKEQPPPNNRYSVFHRQDVDKGFKIDRFLAMEDGAPDESREEPHDDGHDIRSEPDISSEPDLRSEPEEEPISPADGERYVAKMARMERFLMMKPSLADAIQESRPLSGTEIETDTMTATEDEYAPSPMQRLAGMGREEFRSPTPQFDEDEKPEDSDAGYDHNKVRAFLLSSHASDDPSLTALPQMPAPQHADRRDVPRTAFSPPIPEEDTDDSEYSQLSPGLASASLQPGSAIDPERTPRPLETEFNRPLPQPTSKFQDRTRLDHGPTGLPTRKAPSSISTGLTSPLSQGFANSPPLERPIATSPGTRSPAQATSPPASSPHATYPKRFSRLPTKIDTSKKTVDRITSMSSITSAGEDVLAAWAELGGGNDAFAARKRGR